MIFDAAGFDVLGASASVASTTRQGGVFRWHGEYGSATSILGARAAYDDVAHWSYGDVAGAFGIDEDRYLNRVCTTGADLDAALTEAGDTTSPAVIVVELQPLDMTPPTTVIGEMTRRFDYGVYGPANDG